jgi:DNA helicase-2/ATP-dependent DNA helicase PcrA
VKLIKLEQNYRSHGHILDAANALIKHNQGRLGKNLWTSDAQGEPVRAYAAPPTRRGGVHCRCGQRPGRGRVRRRKSPFCIDPTRSRAWSSTRLFNAAMPYRVYGGMRFFERAEVKHALAYLRLIAAPDDDGAFLRW